MCNLQRVPSLKTAFQENQIARIICILSDTSKNSTKGGTSFSKIRNFVDMIIRLSQFIEEN